MTTNWEKEALSDSLLDRLPVLGICGCSGSGKTTLIESLVPAFVEKGLNIAVVKYDAHNILLDIQGKDSDRFFQAGGDVWLLGRDSVCRHHGRVDPLSMFIDLCQTYDLVLVEGHAKTPVPKIWLLGPDDETFPADLKNELAVFSQQETRTDHVFSWLNEWLHQQWYKTPVWGCILIGGQSRRMGTPKHLIKENGRTWLELAVNKLQSKVDRIVISGKGDVPESLRHVVRVPDIPGIDGPLAGVLSVMRWAHNVSWLVTACDLPQLQQEALEWLLAQRAPGVRAILPDLNGTGRVEPLLACYDFRCRAFFEEFASHNQSKLSVLAQNPQVRNPCPPVSLHKSWINVNSPAELKRKQVKRERNI